MPKAAKISRCSLVMVTEDADMRDFLYEELLRDVKRRVAPVRPNRQAPRKEKIPKPHFHHNHKSNCFEQAQLYVVLFAIIRRQRSCQ
jgi:hypothetical protein